MATIAIHSTICRAVFPICQGHLDGATALRVSNLHMGSYYYANFEVPGLGSIVLREETEWLGKWINRIIPRSSLTVAIPEIKSRNGDDALQSRSMLTAMLRIFKLAGS